MESRKIEEIQHYDELARGLSTHSSKWKHVDAHGVKHDLYESYQCVDRWMKGHVSDKHVLDFGCGTGLHSIAYAQYGAHITAIDLSEESLALARTRAVHDNVDHLITFVPMDCERITLEAQTFDIVFDGGTFSSIDLGQALPGIKKVLKPTGTLLFIETFGHNPLANLKRLVNQWRKKRTSWAAEHIVKDTTLELIQKEFKYCEMRYFHLFSLWLFPFVDWQWVHPLFRVIDRFDTYLLERVPFLRRWAFKVVGVCHAPTNSL